MRALAAVGFSNLVGTQNDVLQLMPRVNERIARALHDVSHESLPHGISIYSYFERLPSGRKPVNLRMLPQTKELLIRLDVVAPRADATPEELLSAFLLVWHAMEQQLARYLARRQVPHALADSVVKSLAMPLSQ